MAKLAQGDLVHEFDYVVHAFDGGVEALSPAVDGVLDREEVLAWIGSCGRLGEGGRTPEATAANRAAGRVKREKRILTCCRRKGLN